MKHGLASNEPGVAAAPQGGASPGRALTTMERKRGWAESRPTVHRQPGPPTLEAHRAMPRSLRRAPESAVEPLRRAGAWNPKRNRVGRQRVGAEGGPVRKV